MDKNDQVVENKEHIVAERAKWARPQWRRIDAETAEASFNSNVDLAIAS